jgi:putative ABC transport system substrate-binding protein
VAVLVATGGAVAALAAKAATTTIPIVFTIGGDPVRFGIVTSLSRPGGNMTGVNLFASQMETKRLGLLRALVPKAELIAILLNPNNSVATDQVREVQKRRAPLASKSIFCPRTARAR